MDFHGVPVNVPKLAGHVLDDWYPGWARPKKDKSSDKKLLVIPKWGTPKGWYRV